MVIKYSRISKGNFYLFDIHRLHAFKPVYTFINRLIRNKSFTATPHIAKHGKPAKHAFI